MKRFAFVLGMLLPPLGADWPQEPDGLLYVKFGMMTDEVPGIKPESCYLSNGYKNCTLILNIGDTPLFGTLMFPNEHLSAMMYLFSPDEFDSLEKELVPRFGTPQTRKAGGFTNSKGARLDGPVLEWKGKRVTLIVMKYGTEVDHVPAGMVGIALNSFKEEREKLEQSNPHSSALDTWRNTGALDPFTATVKVTVSSSHDALDAELSSYVSRELRSLSGIQVADKGQDYEISIVAMRVPEERPQLIALSYLFTKVLLAEKAGGLRAALKPEMVSVFNELYREVHTIESFGVITFGASADLRQQCQKLVAQFDSNVLEPQRRTHEQIREQIMRQVGH